MAGEDRKWHDWVDKAREAIDVISPSETIHHDFRLALDALYLMRRGTTLLLGHHRERKPD